nr:MAG TPA: hypothetical protein [Caudoviricetes sp.]
MGKKNSIDIFINALLFFFKISLLVHDPCI